MITKKTNKKTSKKKIKKIIKKPLIKNKIIKEIVKPFKSFEKEVFKKLDEEVRKPILEKEGVSQKPIEVRKFEPRFPRERRFIPHHRFKKQEFRKNDFKSAGEKKIADFLSEEHIHFLYEYPLAITDEDRKIRIWYPDFWLPELNIMVEYMGMKGQMGYDRQMVRKKKIYNALKIDFIEITPGLILKGNWKRFITMKIIDIMKSKNYLFNKMRTLSQKYRVPAEEKKVDLGILDE